MEEKTIQAGEPQIQMPTVKEFISAKTAEGMNYLGKQIKSGAKAINLRKEIVVVESKMTGLAKKIGFEVIGQVTSGEPIEISEEYLGQIVEYHATLEELKERLEAIK